MRPGSGDTEYLVAGCHGKLPFWPEYLDVNVALPASRAFRNWVRDGRQAAGGSQDGHVPPETSRHRFVFAPGGGSDLLAGVIRPSSDIGGKRQFPFSAFVHVGKRHWSGKSYSLLPIALEPVWDALDDLWESLATATSEPAFREIITAARVPTPRPAAIAKAAYDSGQDQAAAPVFDAASGASVEALRANFPDMLRALKHNAGDVRLELPTSSDPDGAAFDAAFWVELINHQFFWKRFEPSLFLEGAPRRSDRKVFLLFGDPAAEDYPRVMGMADQPGVFQRPAHARDGAAASAPSGSAPTYAELAATRFVA